MERIIKIILAVIIIGVGLLCLVGGKNPVIRILGFLAILLSVNCVYRPPYLGQKNYGDDSAG